MSLKDFVIGGSLILGAISLVGAMQFGANYYLNDHHYKTRSTQEEVIGRIDGIFSHTELTKRKDGSISIRRFSLFGPRKTYSDLEGDMDVDRVSISSNSPNEGFEYFIREKHLVKFPKVFEEADRDFREQVERFKPYMDSL